MDDLTEPWLTLPVIVGAYTDQERTDLTLRGIPPTVPWDDERADHPNACRCPAHDPCLVPLSPEDTEGAEE